MAKLVTRFPRIIFMAILNEGSLGFPTRLAVARHEILHEAFMTNFHA